MISARQFLKNVNKDSMTESQQKSRFLLMLFAEIIIVVFMLSVTVSDFVTGNVGYKLFSTILLVSYITSLLLSIFIKNKKIPSTFFCCAIALNFLYSFYVKGNTGIGTIWLLLLPVLSMYVVGLSYGFYSSIVALAGLFTLYLIPYTHEHLIGLYSMPFLVRYTILYIIDFFLSTVSMYNFQMLRIKENESQKQLEAAVIEEHNKVVSISMQTIIAINNAVEAKNIYVGKHSLRVAHFSCLIAERLGWSESEIKRLESIAMLHDIGKIGIESKILNKETRLDDDEYEKMKMHTTIGGKILKDMTIIPRVDLGASFHHEHFDGKGYPNGLVGENIPIEARIVCVADSFDSMRYPRGYKGSLDAEHIKREFEKGRGTQFDPELVDIFIQLCEENNWFADYEV